MIPVGVLASGHTTATPTVTRAWESSWHVLAQVTPGGTQASTWRVLSAVPKSAASAWKVYQQVIATKDAAWDTREAVTVSASVAWNVNSIGTVTATKGVAWHVLAVVPQSVTSAWNVWISVSEKVVYSSWRVLYPVPSAVDVAWKVYERIIATKDAAWNVEVETGTVTGTQTAAWSIKETLAAAAEHASAWDILTTLTPVTKDSAWNIALASASVTSSAECTWRVLAAVPKSFASAWNVLAETSGEPTIQSVTYVGYTARNPWPVVGPTVVDEGDLLIVFLLDDASQTIMFGSGTAAPIPPAGWTEVLPNVERSAAEDVSAFVFWKVAEAADVATGTAKTYSWSWGTYLAVGAYAVVRVADAHPTTPVADVTFVASAAGATSSTISAVTTTSANSTLLLITGVDESNTALDPYWNEPLAPNFISLLGTSGSPSGLGKGSVYTGIAYRSQEASGSSGDVTASIRAENDAIVGYLLALSPAEGSSTVPVTATQNSAWRVTELVDAWIASGWAVASDLVTVSATKSSAWNIDSEGVTYTATLTDSVGALDLDADQFIIFSSTLTDDVGITDEISGSTSTSHVTKSMLSAWDVLSAVTPATKASAWNISASLDAYFTIVETSDIQVNLSAATLADNVATSDLAISLNPDLVLCAGDNAGDGTAAQYTSATYGWAQHWGRAALWDKVRVVPGNHDWTPNNLTDYDSFFGELRGGPASGHWRSFDTTNGWHIALLDVNVANSSGSTQYNWLAADLSANSDKPTILVWHQPRFSNGPHGDAISKGADIWTLCYNSHHQVEIILNGHDHCYQRFVRMNPSRAADATNGIAQMGAAMGGGTDDIPTAGDTLAARSTATTQQGVLLLRLYADRYYWEFVNSSDSTPTLSDSGTQYVRVPLANSSVAKTADSAWKINAQITPATKASAWNVLSSSGVTATTYSSWDVLATLSPATCSAAWDVLSAVTPATKSSAWNVSAGSATSNPTFVKAAYDAGTGAVLTGSATLASNPTSGNLLVVALAWDKASGGASLDSGSWNTLINSSSTSTSLSVFWKVSDGTERTITFTVGSVDLGGQFWIGEYTDSGNPSGTWSVVGSATNPTSEASVTTWSSGTTSATTAAGTALAFFSVDSHGTVDPTLSNSFTERYDGWASGLGRGGLMVGELTGVAASSTVSTTITRGADQQSGAIAVFAKT